MCPPESEKLTLIWTGEHWRVEPATPRVSLKPGSRIEVVIPDSALTTGEREDQGFLLFPRGTFLYLPISPDRDERAVRRISMEHKRQFRPALSKWPTDRDLLPILLEEDLSLQNSRLAPCACRILGRTEQFESLNAAASQGLRLWKNTMAHTINVFDGVYFIHDGRLISLAHKRSEVRDGIPLPANPDPVAEIPELPGLDE